MQVPEFSEARIIVRRGNSLVPISEWLKPDQFVLVASHYKQIHDTMPKSVVMEFETRSNMMEDDK